jgi:hypothetical protein
MGACYQAARPSQRKTDLAHAVFDRWRSNDGRVIRRHLSNN